MRIAPLIVAAWLAGACSAKEGRSAAGEGAEILLAPEPGALSGDYRVATTRVRLLGLQPSETPGGGFATLMELGTFMTRNVRIGDVIGRAWRVSAIDASQLVLTGRLGPLALRPGGEAGINVVHHWIDDAIVYRGKNHWEVGRKAASRLAKTHGVGATAEGRPYYHGMALQLTEVKAGSLLERLDLAAGDFLVSLDGEPLGADGLSRLVDLLARSNRDHVILERNRGGIALRSRLDLR